MKVGESLRRIADFYGFDKQSIQAIEEMAELQKALCKWRRYGYTKDLRRELIDEVADVLIMCRQLEYLIGTNEVKEQIEYKLKRQLKRMEKEE